MTPKKLSLIVIIVLGLASVVYAATTDFRANANVIVPNVPGNGVTADLLIMDGSAESWRYDSTASRVFTVTNPDSNDIFIVGSANPAVKSLRVYNSSGVRVVCINNRMPGSSFVALPTTSGTYSAIPASTYCITRAPRPRPIPRGGK